MTNYELCETLVNAKHTAGRKLKFVSVLYIKIQLKIFDRRNTHKNV